MTTRARAFYLLKNWINPILSDFLNPILSDFLKSDPQLYSIPTSKNGLNPKFISQNSGQKLKLLECGAARCGLRVSSLSPLCHIYHGLLNSQLIFPLKKCSKYCHHKDQNVSHGTKNIVIVIVIVIVISSSSERLPRNNAPCCFDGCANVCLGAGEPHRTLDNNSYVFLSVFVFTNVTVDH